MYPINSKAINWRFSSATSQQLGLTLIELMITVALISLLTIIVMPNYNKYIQQAKRSSAKTSLMQSAIWLERIEAATGKFPNSDQFPKFLSDAALPNYILSLSLTDDGWELLAKPQGSQKKDGCGALRVYFSTIKGDGHDVIRPLGVQQPSLQECWK